MCSLNCSTTATAPGRVPRYDIIHWGLSCYRSVVVENTAHGILHCLHPITGLHRLLSIPKKWQIISAWSLGTNKVFYIQSKLIRYRSLCLSTYTSRSLGSHVPCVDHLRQSFSGLQFLFRSYLHGMHKIVTPKTSGVHRFACESKF